MSYLNTFIKAFTHSLTIGKTDQVKWNILDHNCTIYFLDNSPNGRVLVRWSDEWQKWFFNGEIHRDNGPAIIDHGDLYWYKHGKFHREDGPAIRWKSGWDEYYWNGKPIPGYSKYFLRKEE